MSNIAGSLNSLIWLLLVIVIIAVVIWAVRMPSPRAAGAPTASTRWYNNPRRRGLHSLAALRRAGTQTRTITA